MKCGSTVSKDVDQCEMMSVNMSELNIEICLESIEFN